MSENFITIKNGKFDYDNVKVDDTIFNAAVYAICRVNRYGGHSKENWTVGQHSLACYYMSKDWFPEKPLEFHLGALFHDLEEAYYLDFMTPFKKHLKEKFGFEYDDVTKEFTGKLIEYLSNAVGKKLPDDLFHNQDVKLVDHTMFKLEYIKFHHEIDPSVDLTMPNRLIKNRFPEILSMSPRNVEDKINFILDVYYRKYVSRTIKDMDEVA